MPWEDRYPRPMALELWTYSDRDDDTCDFEMRWVYLEACLAGQVNRKPALGRVADLPSPSTVDPLRGPLNLVVRGRGMTRFEM